MLNFQLEKNLHDEVMNALHWNFAIPRHRVTANVAHGVVTLQGMVEWPYQRPCAEAIVRRVSGVIDVRNEISVQTARGSTQAALAA
jgi:osmotically-inducible protein OsmY